MAPVRGKRDETTIRRPRREKVAWVGGGAVAKILIVDDHAVNRESLAAVLREAGHEVVAATDAASGFDRAREARPDLIISDILMPSGDGYEFVRSLRRDALLSHVPVIFYTAHFNAREALTLARACGVRCVLTKPSTPENIRQTVQAVLAGEDVGAPSGEASEAQYLRLVTSKLAETAEELEWTSSRLMALVEMCLQLSEEREPADLVKAFSRAMRDLVAARHSVVALWEPGQPSTSHVAVSGLSEEAAAAVEAGLTSPTPIPVPLSARGPMRRTGPVSDADDLGLPWTYPPVGAMLVVPVRSGTRQYGWVCATSRISGDAFSADDEQLLSTFASYLGRVFENHCLIAEASQRSRQLELEVARRAASQWRAELQCAVANALAGAGTLAEAAPQMLQAICTKGGFALAELWEIDEAEGRLVPVSSWHDNVPGIAPFLEITRTFAFRRGQGLPGRVWSAQVPVWVADLSTEPTFLRAESAAAAGLKCGMGFPVIVRGQISGVLCVFGPAGRPPDADLITLFEAVGGQVGQFIERRRQEQRLVRLSRIHAILVQMGAIIGSDDCRTGLFQRVCRIAVEDGGFVGAEVFTLTPSGEVTIAAAARAGGPDTPPGAGTEQIVRDVFAGAEPVIDNRRGLSPSREGALAAFPLAHGGRVRAVLMLQADATGLFAGAELMVVRQMAADVSLALDALESRMAARFGAAAGVV